jgi:hypothetical protein
MTDPIDLALERLYASDTAQPPSSKLGNLNLHDVTRLSTSTRAVGGKNLLLAGTAAAAVMAVGLGPRLLHSNPAVVPPNNPAHCIPATSPASSPTVTEVNP